jgi:cytoskeleton protein RodZ
MSAGLLLRQARESVGMSLEELSEIICVRRTVLNDLENDNFESSGGIIYARGHIRNIARALHANEDLLVEEFNTMNQDFNRPIVELLNENSVIPVDRKHIKISFGLMAKVAAVVVVLLVAIPTAASFTHTPSKSAAKSPTSSLAPASASTTSGTLDGTTAVATKSSAVSVVVAANFGSTWLAVTDSSGAQIFSGMLTKGSSQSFADSQLINVTIGNAGAVDLNVNGKDAGAPGTTGEVVHLQFGPGVSSQG